MHETQPGTSVVVASTTFEKQIGLNPSWIDLTNRDGWLWQLLSEFRCTMGTQVGAGYYCSKGGMKVLLGLNWRNGYLEWRERQKSGDYVNKGMKAEQVKEV